MKDNPELKIDMIIPPPSMPPLSTIKKPHKYHARATMYKGIWYASKKEAKYAEGLDSRDDVDFWLRQVPFDLPGKARYLLDFMVFYKGGRWEFVEIKGRDLPLGKLKRRQTEEIYNIEIKVV